VTSTHPKLTEDRVAIRFRAISKRFGATVANDSISFAIGDRSMHALLGENGAGKTTLMRILAGELLPEDGDIFIDGCARRIASPSAARALGIRLVHQHSSLIPNLTIAENFVLTGPARGALLHIGALADELRDAAKQFGIDIDPRQQVWELSASQRQWLEVFRATYRGGRIIVLDEPTSLLSPIEGDALLDRLKGLARSGATIVLITHKLREVFKYADDVTILRKGRQVATLPVKDVDDSALAEMMIERANVQPAGNIGRSRDQGKMQRLVAEARELSVRDSRGRVVLNSVSFDLRSSAILGVAGVSGNGQTELARVLAGLDQRFGGSIVWHGETKAVCRYIPDDRVSVGTASALSVLDNLMLRSFRSNTVSRKGFLDSRRLTERAASLVSDFQIKIRALDEPVHHLSGGNIQRVVLARELSDHADLIIAHNPTAGLDIATAVFVRNQLVETARSGSAVLLISDEIDELFAVADQLLVLHEGAVAGVLEREQFDTNLVATLMAGGKLTPATRLPHKPQNTTSEDQQ
jgi:simple sugar transport system ATP-binding protein